MTIIPRLWSECIEVYAGGCGLNVLRYMQVAVVWMYWGICRWLWSECIEVYAHGWEWKILVLLKNKKISSRGPLSWRNSRFVSCACKRRWRLGGRKCRKMPENDICICRKAKSSSCTLYTCWNRVKKKKKKEILILKVWFYGNSVKLLQSPSHVCRWLWSECIEAYAGGCGLNVLRYMQVTVVWMYWGICRWLWSACQWWFYLGFHSPLLLIAFSFTTKIRSLITNLPKE